MRDIIIAIIFILTAAAIAYILFFTDVFGGGIEPEARIDMPLGGAIEPIEETISILDEEYSLKQYDDLKTNLAKRIDEMWTKPLKFEERDQIIAVWNYEASKGSKFQVVDNKILIK